MSELEEKLGALLQNPQLMQQIMGMASALSQSQEPPKEERPAPKPKEKPQPMPQIDPGMLQTIAGLMQSGGIDAHQQGLLRALKPYLRPDRITRLERAMHAARMAGAASTLLGSGGLQKLVGR